MFGRSRIADWLVCFLLCEPLFILCQFVHSLTFNLISGLCWQNMHFSTKLGGGGCKTRAGTDKNNNKALLWATKPLVVHIICHFCFFSHSVVFPSSPLNLSSSLVLLPHGSSHLPLPPPHSLQRLCSDSYVWVERGLLLICAEWEKAVLARRKKKKPSLACTVGWMEGWMNGWINGLICHSNANTLGFTRCRFF